MSDHTKITKYQLRTHCQPFSLFRSSSSSSSSVNVGICYHSISCSEWCWNCIENFIRFHHAVYEKRHASKCHFVFVIVIVSQSVPAMLEHIHNLQKQTHQRAHTSNASRECVRLRHKESRVMASTQHNTTQSSTQYTRRRHRFKGRQNFTFLFFLFRLSFRSAVLRRSPHWTELICDDGEINLEQRTYSPHTLALAHSCTHTHSCGTYSKSVRVNIVSTKLNRIKAINSIECGLVLISDLNEITNYCTMPMCPCVWIVDRGSWSVVWNENGVSEAMAWNSFVQLHTYRYTLHREIHKIN